MLKSNRKRLHPWLEASCNNNAFTGLKWFDKERKMFRISWRRQNSAIWDESEAMVFKAWALHTGLYKEGDPVNWSHMKTRLRTALTKLNDIKEIKDYHDIDHPTDPYKVYQFLSDETEQPNSQSPPSVESGYLGSPNTKSPVDLLNISHDVVDDVLKPENDIKENVHSQIPTVVYETDLLQVEIHQAETHQIDNYERNIFPSNINNNYESSNITSTSNTHDIIDQNEYESTLQQPSMPSDLNQIDSGNLMQIDSNELKDLSFGLTLPSFPPFLATSKGPTIQLNLFFLDIPIYEESVEDKARLFCGNFSQQVGAAQCTGISNDPTVFGPNDIKQICLPYVNKVRLPLTIKEEQRKSILKVQENMQRGILVGVNENGDIYIQRLCKSCVYAWKDENENIRLTRHKNEQPVCIFNFDAFKKSLDEYTTGCGRKPLPYVILTFGREFSGINLELCCVPLSVKLLHGEAYNLLKGVCEKELDSEVHISNSISGDYLPNELRKLNISQN